METEPDTSVIETFTGKRFSLADPKPDQICIEDIARALARICRFTGHCERFYSVAAHSVWCQRYAKARNRSAAEQLTVLMHDAPEAYIGDINSPLKRLLGYGIRQIEARIWQVIIKKYHLVLCDWHDEDLTALASEAKMLLPSGGSWWGLPRPAAFIQPGFSEPNSDESFFLATFENLRDELAKVKPVKPPVKANNETE